jgi:hypothetical protein
MSSRPKQSMSELKLRRLLEHNQRLREDLGRPRIRVSEASASLIRYCKTTTDHLVSPLPFAPLPPFPFYPFPFPLPSRSSPRTFMAGLMHPCCVAAPMLMLCVPLCRFHLCGVLWGETRTRMHRSPAVGVVTYNRRSTIFLCLPPSRPTLSQVGPDERNQTHIHSHSGLPPHT